MTTRVKICGITRAEDALLAAALGVSAVGFVFWPGSPRLITPDAARRISRALPPLVTRVGVFVNMTPDEVAAIVARAELDVAQLHGEEVPGDFAGAGARVIKTVTLESDDRVDEARGLPDWVTPLVDASDRTRRGGTGERANWQRAARLAATRSIVLAGGLTAENVADAIAEVRPLAVDVSSGVESAPGIKSRDRMVAFVEAVLGHTRAGGMRT
jgi:phosphoribosylanthranilate isomerase